MTCTLVLISLCYFVFVSPIYCCSIFGIIDVPYLICFILYWFQVSFSELKVDFSIYKIPQYSTNFIIYAARSVQYRRAYILFIRSCLPWLFEINPSGKSKRKLNAIFIIHPILNKSYRNPKPKNIKYTNPSKFDIEEKLDLNFENVKHSRYDHVDHVGKETSTILFVSSNDFNIKKKTRFQNHEEEEFSFEVNFDLILVCDFKVCI